jgi:hypothetical protein
MTTAFGVTGLADADPKPTQMIYQAILRNDYEYYSYGSGELQS